MFFPPQVYLDFYIVEDLLFESIPGTCKQRSTPLPRANRGTDRDILNKDWRLSACGHQN